jgi:hypothetical protein
VAVGAAGPHLALLSLQQQQWHQSNHYEAQLSLQLRS